MSNKTKKQRQQDKAQRSRFVASLKSKIFKLFLEYCNQYIATWGKYEKICYWVCYSVGRILLWCEKQRLDLDRMYATPSWWDVLKAIPGKGLYWMGKYLGNKGVKKHFFACGIPDLISRLVEELPSGNLEFAPVSAGEDQFVGRPLIRLRRYQRSGEWSSNLWRFSPEFIEWLHFKKGVTQAELQFVTDMLYKKEEKPLKGRGKGGAYTPNDVLESVQAASAVLEQRIIDPVAAAVASITESSKRIMLAIQAKQPATPEPEPVAMVEPEPATPEPVAMVEPEPATPEPVAMVEPEPATPEPVAMVEPEPVQPDLDLPVDNPVEKSDFFYPTGFDFSNSTGFACNSSDPHSLIRSRDQKTVQRGVDNSLELGGLVEKNRRIGSIEGLEAIQGPCLQVQSEIQATSKRIMMAIQTEKKQKDPVIHNPATLKNAGCQSQGQDQVARFDAVRQSQKSRGCSLWKDFELVPEPKRSQYIRIYRERYGADPLGPVPEWWQPEPVQPLATSEPATPEPVQPLATSEPATPEPAKQGGLWSRLVKRVRGLIQSSQQ